MSQSLSVYLDREHFFTGEFVTGRVSFSNNDPGLEARYLHLKVKGVERTYVVGVGEKKNTWAQQDHTVLKCTVPLADFRSHPKVPTGVFEYPFSFYLSPELPSSHHGKAEGAKGKAEFACYYELKAYLEKEGSDIREKVSFKVSHAVQQIKPISGSKEKDSKMALGKIIMKVDIEKNIFISGEKAKVQVSVDNKSSRGIDHIKVKLMRDVKVKAGGIKFRVESEVEREKTKGVSSKSKGDKELEIKLKDIQPTCHGSLFRVDYSLVAVCDIKMAKDVELKSKSKVLLPIPAHNPTKAEFKKVWDHKKIKKKTNDSDDDDGFFEGLAGDFIENVISSVVDSIFSDD